MESQYIPVEPVQLSLNSIINPEIALDFDYSSPYALNPIMTKITKSDSKISLWGVIVNPIFIEFDPPKYDFQISSSLIWIYVIMHNDMINIIDEAIIKNFDNNLPPSDLKYIMPYYSKYMHMMWYYNPHNLDFVNIYTIKSDDALATNFKTASLDLLLQSKGGEDND